MWKTKKVVFLGQNGPKLQKLYLKSVFIDGKNYNGPKKFNFRENSLILVILHFWTEVEGWNFDSIRFITSGFSC